MATLLSLEMLQNKLAHTVLPRILYIEDNVELANLFKQHMEQEGFHVDLAYTGTQGLSYLAQYPYELVVFDDLLPELNGLQILRRLVENERHPPAIMVTGEDETAIMVEALRLGIADIVIRDGKTTGLQHLPNLVSRVVQQHRRHAQRESVVEDLYGQNRKLALLNRATQIITSTLDEEQIAAQLVSSICEFTDTEGSSVWLVKEQASGEARLECVAIFANGEHFTPRHVPLKLDEGIAGWSFSQNETAIADEAERDTRFSIASDIKLGFHTKSLLAAPMRAPDRVLGVLELVNKRSGPFTRIDQTLTETLAASAAIAIENARYFQDLNRNAEELRLRNEELDAFAHTVAHDLKTPLSIITGYADMLRENFELLHPDEADLYLKQIVDNGMRMNHIIDSLLLLAGVRGASRIEIEPVDMMTIVHESLNRIAFMIEERKAVIHLPDEWPLAMGFGPWLEEVWYNYIVNALKYGGEPPEITFGYDFPNEFRVRFWLSDRGSGVAEDTSSLFTPSLRFPRGEKRKGYGLGLSIVKRIVERLNGTVGVSNLPEGGALFYFTLPAVVDEVE